MKCSRGCKYFKMHSIIGKGGGFYGEITESGYGGRCNKYDIQITTFEDCLDTLPYNKK